MVMCSPGRRSRSRGATCAGGEVPGPPAFASTNCRIYSNPTRLGSGRGHTHMARGSVQLGPDSKESARRLDCAAQSRHSWLARPFRAIYRRPFHIDGGLGAPRPAGGLHQRHGNRPQIPGRQAR
jgi:hypothetical protein